MSDKGCEADIRPRRVNVAEVPSPDMIDPHLARRQFAIDALQAEGSMERDDLIDCPHRHGGNLLPNSYAKLKWRSASGCQCPRSRPSTPRAICPLMASVASAVTLADSSRTSSACAVNVPICLRQ
jgi:hypothetical protein